MRRRLTTAKSSIIHFKRKLRQFQFEVVPPPPVPAHIIKPQYAVNKQKPQFALYNGQPAIYSQPQIEKIKKSAKIASDTLHATALFINEKAAINLENGTDGTLTAEDIDQFVFNYIVAKGAYPTPIGFLGFPKSVCVSINQCIVHGIPSKRPIYLGDKVNLDVTAYFNGYHGDTNLTLIYGGEDKAPTVQVKNIMKLTQQALYKAISICRPGVRFNQIGKTIQQFAAQKKIHVCQHFTGHGVGPLLHMPPMVYHVYFPQCNYEMKVGNVFTIEPVMSHKQSSEGLQLWSDGMTVISENNPNAQFEHMILIVNNGCEVLTQRPGENIPNPNGNIQNLQIY